MHLVAFYRQPLDQILILDYCNRVFPNVYKLNKKFRSNKLMVTPINWKEWLLSYFEICLVCAICVSVSVCVRVSQCLPFIRLHCSFKRLQFRSLPKTLQNSSCTDFHARFFKAVKSASKRLFSMMFISRLHNSNKYRFSSNAQF